MKRRLSSLLVLCASMLVARMSYAADALPRPPELEPAVQFWIRVYTEVSTNEGFVHDAHNLGVVYQTLHFSADLSPRERERQVDAARSHYQTVLHHLAAGIAPADADEQRVHDLWGDEGTSSRLAQAADDVRFQLGQSDRFRSGLVRAGTWEAHIGEVLANSGLPAELAALPHVESSFDPAAYSKVGAAGLWQFMRSTGRRFLRIDNTVDERMDPFRATEAAVQLLSYNYRLLGTWPLAITAYNHGAAGMLRARDQLGTDDIVRIVRDYKSPSFGFASRNYYVSFLAALTIAQSPDKYFGNFERNAEPDFNEVKLSASTQMAPLLHAVGVDRDTLRTLNPALRPPIWNGKRAIPAGYVLRLPGSQTPWTSAMLTARLANPSASRALVASTTTPIPVAKVTTAAWVAKAAAALPPPPPAATVVASAPTTAPVPDTHGEYYLVQQGDDVDDIAGRLGLPLSQLMSLNSIHGPDDIYDGERLRLVAAAPEPETVTTPATVASAKAAVQDSLEEDAALAAQKKVVAKAEPVSAAQAQAQGPELVPGAVGTQSADPVDYSVAADGTVRVVAAETLGHYADWLGISASKLRTLNNLRGRNPVVLGRRIKLQFGSVSREQFEQKRREYHEQLEAAYFGSHRIAGSQVYIVRRGDSLWSITQRNVKVPVWLLQQYNPDLDFHDLRPGTQISLPQVEDVTAL